ncbi:MAG: hypothetical protein QXD80_00550 [Acidilobaceae archaeon]
MSENLIKQVKDIIDSAKPYLSTSRGRVILRDKRGLEYLDLVKDMIVNYYIGDSRLYEVNEWISKFKSLLFDSIKLINGRGWSLPREFKSFIEDPRVHLRKKLFNYTFDLVRGKLSFEDYIEKSRQAVTTSFNTNIRSLYQYWILLGVIYNLGLEGAHLVYPEHGYIMLDRSGRQKTGSIPPNIILKINGRGELSFFIEAPRPLGWEDTRDLSRVWKLYVIFRPDILVYSGRVLDIVDLRGDIPVIRPDIIIECKEQPDWYIRSRYLKGPIAKPLTAEEWMSRWLKGLWEGLGEALGVSREKLGEFIEERRGSIKVKELDLITFYKETYKPKLFILISKPKIDEAIKKTLQSRNIVVIDNVEIGDIGKLREVSKIIKEYAKPVSEDIIDTIRVLISLKLNENINRDIVERALLKLASSRIEELVDIILEER